MSAPRHCHRVFATTLTLLGTVAAAPPPSVDRIIVQGQRQRAQIDDFVAQLHPASGNTQLGKFLQPVCPDVAGLPAAQDIAVANRMRRLATAAGVEVASSRCTTNVLVMIVKDKSRAMAALSRKRPDLVAGLPTTEFKRLSNSPDGAAAWQVVDLTGTDGMPLTSVRLTSPSDAAGSVSIRHVQAFTPPSRLREFTVPQFLQSVVLIEAAVARDITTTQLADYALMRALTGARETDSAPKQSILNLVNADRARTEAPLSATWWDIAFLKSLYATNNAVQASAQRDAIARQMERELKETPIAER